MGKKGRACVVVLVGVLVCNITLSLLLVRFTLIFFNLVLDHLILSLSIIKTHIKMLASLQVDIVAYGGSIPHEAVLKHPSIHIHTMAQLRFINLLPKYQHLTFSWFKIHLSFQH